MLLYRALLCGLFSFALIGSSIFAFIDPCLAEVEDASFSLPDTDAILGGGFLDLWKGPVALLRNSKFECSGVLVGPGEILTAAHCASASVPASDWKVVVGGRIYGVNKAWYSAKFNPGGGANYSNAQYDIGLLQLSSVVSGTSPVPVLYDDPVQAGEYAAIFGYGTNEISGSPGVSSLDRGKGAKVKVGGVNGLISSSHQISGSSACQGDSGGPAVQNLYDHTVVVGVLSTTTNPIVNGNCQLGGAGIFNYVNLQSSASRGFLKNFPNIRMVSGKDISFNAKAKVLSKSVSSTMKLNSLKKIKAKAASLVSKASTLKKSATKSRSLGAKTVLLGLKVAKGSQTKSEAKAILAIVSKTLKLLVAKGVY